MTDYTTTQGYKIFKCMLPGLTINETAAFALLDAVATMLREQASLIPDLSARVRALEKDCEHLEYHLDTHRNSLHTALLREKELIAEVNDLRSKLVEATSVKATVKRIVPVAAIRDRKIAAIKEYRKLTGQGLYNSKCAVDKFCETEDETQEAMLSESAEKLTGTEFFIVSKGKARSKKA